MWTRPNLLLKLVWVVNLSVSLDSSLSVFAVARRPLVHVYGRRRGGEWPESDARWIPNGDAGRATAVARSGMIERSKSSQGDRGQRRDAAGESFTVAVGHTRNGFAFSAARATYADFFGPPQNETTRKYRSGAVIIIWLLLEML